jgi:hypothetical protein
MNGRREGSIFLYVSAFLLRKMQIFLLQFIEYHGGFMTKQSILNFLCGGAHTNVD